MVVGTKEPTAITPSVLVLVTSTVGVLDLSQFLNVMTNTKNQNALISVKDQNGNQVVDARELHKFLNPGTKFSMWIDRRIEEYGFVENEDFEVLLKNGKNLKGGRPTKEYAISLDMGKELAMVERSDQGRQVRKYFIEVEKRYKEAKNNTFSYSETRMKNGIMKISGVKPIDPDTQHDIDYIAIVKVLLQLRHSERRMHQKREISKRAIETAMCIYDYDKRQNEVRRIFNEMIGGVIC